MKRLIAALGLAVFALSASAIEFGPPHEELNTERALPNLPEKTARASAGNSTRSDASSAPAESPWANDWNFIAPAL